VVDLIRKYKDNFLLDSCQGPLIFATQEEPISSITIKVERAQKAATETGVQVQLKNTDDWPLATFKATNC